ncbi:MAG: PDZ domain-containing protein [Deltaproteobacteria bacterium]|nr:PDZ domain-containing protein [Deltaproteobacteria bacterium]
MMKRLVIGGALIALGALGSALWRRETADATPPQRLAAASGRLSRLDAPAATRLARGGGEDLAARIDALTAQLGAERAERQRLAERLEAMTEQLARLESGAPIEPADAAVAANASSADATAALAAPAAAPVDYSLSPMERALVAAGIEPDQAAEMKRRRDALTMQEITLRDQATREQWIDTPRFAEALDAIAAQQVSVRDEIGDLAYDRYLFAEGRTNRVRVDDVLSESPAAAVGLQPGDLILTYADARLFAPDDLVNETRGGVAGDTVRLQVSRGGQRFEVEVPRGPLGLRVNAAQDMPAEG